MILQTAKTKEADTNKKAEKKEAISADNCKWDTLVNKGKEWGL